MQKFKFLCNEWYDDSNKDDDDNDDVCRTNCGEKKTN